jgi:hypothetical protein
LLKDTDIAHVLALQRIGCSEVKYRESESKFSQTPSTSRNSLTTLSYAGDIEKNSVLKINSSSGMSAGLNIRKTTSFCWMFLPRWQGKRQRCFAVRRHGRLVREYKAESE